MNYAVYRLLGLFFFLAPFSVTCNLLRLYQQQAAHQRNPVIYVNMGDSINISCLFDPNLIMIHYKANKPHMNEEQQLPTTSPQPTPESFETNEKEINFIAPTRLG